MKTYWRKLSHQDTNPRNHWTSYKLETAKDTVNQTKMQEIWRQCRQYLEKIKVNVPNTQRSYKPISAD